MKKKFLGRLGKLLLVFNTSLFILSLSISVTLLFRTYNYYHIDYVDIDKSSGITKEEEEKSYDEVVDYLVYNKTLETKKIKYTKDNVDHFIDFNTLIIINIVILGITFFGLLLKRRFRRYTKIRNHSIGFWGSILSIAIVVITSIVTLILGFDKMFDLLSFVYSLGHNWELDIKNNEVFKIFPREFFVDSATFIVFLIVFISVILIVRDIIRIRKEKKEEPLIETNEPVKQ